MFYKILNGMAPDHIPEHISSNFSSRRNDIRLPFSRTGRYDNSLDSTIKSSTSLNRFKTNLNKFVRPKGNFVFTVRDNFGIKLLTKIRVCFSFLRDHRYNPWRSLLHA